MIVALIRTYSALRAYFSLTKSLYLVYSVHACMKPNDWNNVLQLTEKLTSPGEWEDVVTALYRDKIFSEMRLALMTFTFFLRFPYARANSLHVCITKHGAAEINSA